MSDDSFDDMPSLVALGNATLPGPSEEVTVSQTLEDKDTTLPHYPAKTGDTEGGSKMKGANTLLQMAENGILKSLAKATTGPLLTARYCCGGTINPGDPISLRIDDPENEIMSRKFNLPLSDDEQKSYFSIFTSAGILKEGQFSTNFDTQEITDAIAQVLLPSARSGNGKLQDRTEHRGVKAVLANLCAEPSKSPLVIATAPDSFGTLMVCLPHSYYGGEIEVSNGGHSMSFAAGDGKKMAKVRWFAYVNNCGTKIFPVERGKRITLVYKLIVTEQIGRSLRDETNAILDPMSFPLYEGAKAMLEKPGFMKKGGTIGKYCKYKYFHTNPQAAKLLPYALKGVDLVFYRVFELLGCKVSVRPALAMNILEDWEQEGYDEYIDTQVDTDNECPGCGGPCCSPDTMNFSEWKKKMSRVARVGKELHEIKFYEAGIEEENYMSFFERESALEDAWPFDSVPNLKWLSKEPDAKSDGWEVAVVHSWNDAYAQETVSEPMHSHLAIFIEVPKMLDRNIVA